MSAHDKRMRTAKFNGSMMRYAWSSAAAITERLQDKTLLRDSSNIPHNNYIIIIPTGIEMVHIRHSNNTIIAQY